MTMTDEIAKFEPPTRILMGPGPSNAPASVLAAMARPVIGHLDPECLRMLDEIDGMLRRIFMTSNELTFPVSGSGTAGMECALMNVLEPGDTAVVLVSGFFAERMREIANRTGARVQTIGGEWGRPVDPDEVFRALKRYPEAKAVCAVHAETSTGVLQPLEEIGDLCSAHGALFLVDAVASLGGIPVNTDEWKIDVCYSGSQKCLSVPPGLAPITFSPQAIRAREERLAPPQSFYLDALFIWKYVGRERRYHHTAPVNMLYGLHEGLRLILEEGLEARWQRHEEIGGELVAGLQERGFDPVPPEGFRLPQLAVVSLPEGLDERAARLRLLEEFGIEVGGGLGEFAGKVWRIGVMGASADRENLKALFRALDQILAG
jgi:alanine-glyoxylate transaminase / serine-glyoxylate transaminase / serine-pyruvate transaminase